MMITHLRSVYDECLPNTTAVVTPKEFEDEVAHIFGEHGVSYRKKPDYAWTYAEVPANNPYGAHSVTFYTEVSERSNNAGQTLYFRKIPHIKVSKVIAERGTDSTVAIYDEDNEYRRKTYNLFLSQYRTRVQVEALVNDLTREARHSYAVARETMREFTAIDRVVSWEDQVARYKRYKLLSIVKPVPDLIYDHRK